MASSTSSQVAMASSCHLKATFSEMDTTFWWSGDDGAGGEFGVGVESVE